MGQSDEKIKMEDEEAKIKWKRTRKVDKQVRLKRRKGKKKVQNTWIETAHGRRKR